MGQIPNFCINCLARLPDSMITRVCSDCHKTVAIRRMHDMPGSISKQAMLTMLADDLKQHQTDPGRLGEGAAAKVRTLYETVQKHPWDDCAKFLSQRLIALEGPKPSYRENARTPAQDEAAIVPILPILPKSHELKATPWEQLRDVERGDGLRDVGRVNGLRDVVEHLRRGLIPLGFGPTAIAGNSTAIFHAHPQVPFRGKQLVIPSAIANNFIIDDIKVGRNSTFAVANGIPAAAFNELGHGVILEMDWGMPGILIVMSISNITGCPCVFTAVLLGETIQ